MFAEHPGEWLRRARPRARAAADRRLRARLRDGGARLRGARRRVGRARCLGSGLRPRARGQVRRGARVGAREHAHQRGRRPGRARRLRARQDRGRADGRGRAGLHRHGLLPDDDGHGPDGARRERLARVQVPRRDPPDRRATTCSSTASRSPGPGGHWVEFSRPICAGTAVRRRRLPRWRRTTSTSRPRRATMKAGHDRPRRASCRLEGLPRPRLHARPRHGPLDRA